MNFILRICFPSILRVVAQHAEALIVCLDLTLNIIKQPTFHDWVPELRVYVNEKS